MTEVVNLNQNITLNHSNEIDPTTIISGSPNERLASLFNIPAGGELEVGIWESDAYEEQIDNYPVNEIMVVLSGGATMVSASGVKTDLKPGDTVYLPKGWSGKWIQTETIRKITLVV